MSNQNTGAGTLMLAFLAGAVTGAAVALLYAPAAGEETREDPQTQRAREGRDRARGALEQGRDAIQRQREGVTSAIERGREAFEQARSEGPSA